MSDFLKMEYNVDMVFCIDATGSMSPVLNRVKENALNFYNDVIETMNLKQKSITGLRVRVIAFRDYIADHEKAMLTTDFFQLPQQSVEFEKCIQSIYAQGGGDEPEDGLEALAYAIKSNWSKEGNKRRNVIVVWTDASTHEIGYGKEVANYPKGMPQSLAELTAWWGDAQTPGFISDAAKRLVLFAPQAPYWQDITNSWNNVIHYTSKAGEGLEEYTYKEIIDVICNSF